MKRIFITHAGKDSATATQLAEDLRNAGHEAIVDTKELLLGDDSIEFMNRGIEDAQVIVILWSKHTAEAKWQKLEIHGAIWNEVAQAGAKCIVLKLDETKIYPLLGPKVYGNLDPSKTIEYKQLIDKICDDILPSETATTVVNKALNPDSPNPFRRIRAEYFEEHTELLSKAFASPEASRIGSLEEVTPCFLEGSRGTGKSMLLLSLRARVYMTRNKTSGRLTKVFGFYLKFTRGALCNVGVSKALETSHDPDVLRDFPPDQVSDICGQEIIICMLESMFSELDSCIAEGLVGCDFQTQKNLSQNVASLLSLEASSVSSFAELLSTFAATHRRIAEFIRRKFIYRETPTVPVASLDLDAFKQIVSMIKRSVPQLKESLFVALLDEYENLFPYQQRIVNTIVKLAAPAMSVKVAKKLGASDVSGTTIGQDLQETHDYTRLVLVYDVEDKATFKLYRNLLARIVAKILESEGYVSSTVETLLDEFSDDEISPEEVRGGVAALYKITPTDFEQLPPAEQASKLNYYSEAAIYRVLYGKKGSRQEKRFAGFGDLAFLSSGVIRYFQEMLGVAYYLTYADDAPNSKNLVIPPEKQTRSAHIVSIHNATTLSRNVEAAGEALKYFLFDLGDCLREKLLHHGSEPEAARITLIDPELLENEEFESLRCMLNVGTREGVFQTREGRPAFKPRHSSDPQPAEFNVSRIFAPVLQISPRLRWRTEVSCDDLRKLLSPELRAEAKKILIAKLSQRKATKGKRPPASGAPEFPGF